MRSFVRLDIDCKRDIDIYQNSAQGHLRPYITIPDAIRESISYFFFLVLVKKDIGLQSLNPCVIGRGSSSAQIVLVIYVATYLSIDLSGFIFGTHCLNKITSNNDLVSGKVKELTIRSRTSEEVKQKED